MAFVDCINFVVWLIGNHGRRLPQNVGDGKGMVKVRWNSSREVGHAFLFLYLV